MCIRDRCVATLGVLRAAAQRRPVLAVVDDLQWIDASSRECIEYAARRAGGPLAVVLAARDPWYPPEHVHLPELQVGPVDDVGAAELCGTGHRTWRRPSPPRSRRPPRVIRWPWSS